MLLSYQLATRRFAATSPDHRLLFHGLQLSAATPLWLITERHRSRVELKSTVCDLPRRAKRQGYRFIGKTLLAPGSSLRDKWRLRGCANREDAYCGTGGIFIRDTACDTACSLWFNELWPNQGQTMRNHTPYHTAYTTVWRMILGRMHALKCKKISCKSLQKSIEAMVMKEKRLSQITLSLFD